MRYEILEGDSVVNTIVATPEFMETNYSGRYRLIEEEEPEPQEPSAKRVLTKLAYLNRFTDEELAGIYATAKTVPLVEVWLEKFKVAEEINLDDERTASGLHTMEAVGLLAPGRALEILT